MKDIERFYYENFYKPPDRYYPGDPIFQDLPEDGVKSLEGSFAFWGWKFHRAVQPLKAELLKPIYFLLKKLSVTQ